MGPMSAPGVGGVTHSFCICLEMAKPSSNPTGFLYSWKQGSQMPARIHGGWAGTGTSHRTPLRPHVGTRALDIPACQDGVPREANPEQVPRPLNPKNLPGRQTGALDTYHSPGLQRVPTAPGASERGCLEAGPDLGSKGETNGGVQGGCLSLGPTRTLHTPETELHLKHCALGILLPSPSPSSACREGIQAQGGPKCILQGR